MNKYTLIRATLPEFNTSLDFLDHRNIRFINNNISDTLNDILYTLRINNPRMDDSAMKSALCYKIHRIKKDPAFYNCAIKSLPYDIIEIVNNRLCADIKSSELFHFRYTGDKLRQILGKRLISDLPMRKKYINYLSDKLDSLISHIDALSSKLTNRQNQELFLIYREINFLYDEFKLFLYAI